MTRRISAIVLALGFLPFFTSCVSVEMAQLPSTTQTSGPTQSFPDVEGGTTVTTLHFTVHGYNESDMRQISGTAEDIFNKIGNDTGLYSYLASQNYALVVYKDQNEYMQKTKQPNWSHAVTVGTGTYTYAGSNDDAALAHEVTVMALNNYFGDKAASVRWLVEGMAMYEEFARMTGGDRNDFTTLQQRNLRTNEMPFNQMTFFIPTSEEKRHTEVWNQQVESVVAYLLTQGSSLTFASLLNDLRSGAIIDNAISNNYPGKFRNFGDVETAWKTTI